jgi:DNA repair exonuclease SbcCD ATPase subunit
MEEEKSLPEEVVENEEHVETEEQDSAEDNQQEYDEEVVEQESKKQRPNSENIRALREDRERLQRERDEYYRRLQELENQRAPQQAPQQEPYTPPAPDDLVEWRQVERELKRRDEENERYRKQMEMASVEARLKSQFPDFDSIVSSENINRLNMEEPELAKSIGSNQDPYTQAVAAYRAIKRISPSHDAYRDEKEKITKNNSKPRPSNATSKSPLTNANAFGKGLTAEQKRAIYKEMQDIIS